MDYCFDPVDSFFLWREGAKWVLLSQQPIIHADKILSANKKPFSSFIKYYIKDVKICLSSIKLLSVIYTILYYNHLLGLFYLWNLFASLKISFVKNVFKGLSNAIFIVVVARDCD